eukprot:TRINITY_DN7770_c0_g1_i15.p1 TRINITY_DN7770_c0_g1~~TRINITY_DN7770_c0_g1_i15.p1  ORF type:complete len:229 (-),score=35.92 TRINITY_DN7770_c0_g1_i15:25-711(-)
MILTNPFYDIYKRTSTVSSLQINQTRKLLLQSLDLKQNTDLFAMDIKILIDNPVLSHTSRRVGCASPMKCLSNNERYKQVRGISLRSMQNTQYSFPLRSPEFSKHSISKKKLLHQRAETQGRHRKTLTVPVFESQQSAEAGSKSRGALRLAKRTRGRSKVKKALNYLTTQANFFRSLLRKRVAVAASVCSSPREFSGDAKKADEVLSLIHICRCRRYAVCRSRWSPYH